MPLFSPRRSDPPELGVEHQVPVELTAVEVSGDRVRLESEGLFDTSGGGPLDSDSDCKGVELVRRVSVEAKSVGQ